MQNANSSNASNQNTNNEYRYSFRFIQEKLDINTDLTRGILNQSSDPSPKVGYNFQYFNNTTALIIRTELCNFRIYSLVGCKDKTGHIP